MDSPDQVIRPQNADATLYLKLARVMAQMKRLPKTGHNDHFGYDFVTEGDVSDAIRSALAEQNIAFFADMLNVQQDRYERQTQKGVRFVTRTRAQFAFTFACGETGATRTCTWEAEAEDDSDKGINKVATAAEKYFLLKTFILSSGDDPDAGPRPRPQNQQRQQAPQQRYNNNGRQQPPPPDEPPHPVITTQEAKETLGNGTNRRISTDASNLGWANPTTLDQIYEALNKRIPGVSHGEILRYAGVDKWNNETAWNAKFSSGREAVAHILKVWEVDSQPPAKDWTEDEKAIFANWIKDNFGRSVEQVENETETDYYSVYKSPIDATHAIVQRATQEHWDVHSTVAFYNGQYIDFKTAVGMIRVYGRSTEFKKSVGEPYYSANHIESWVTDTKPKAVAPVRLKWAIKGEGDKSYYISDKGQQTPAEAAPVAAAADNSILDSDIPF